MLSPGSAASCQRTRIASRSRFAGTDKSTGQARGCTLSSDAVRMTMKAIHPESAVRDRYAAAAQTPAAALCCAVDYERHLLENIPEEVIQKDYGCGDPSRYL